MRDQNRISSSGHRFEVDGPLDDQLADAVILLASYSPAGMMSDQLKHWLRRRAVTGTMMGCVDTGALIFAEAGLLDRHPAAIHHEAIIGFRETYGDALFADRLFDLDGARCSSAGGVATFDMTLAVVEHFADSQLARRVAEIMNYQALPNNRTEGIFGRDWSVSRIDRTLGMAIEMMQANIEEPLSIQQICEHIGWPIWRLRRLFHRHLSVSPQAYYVELRLERARNLLRNASESVGSIALICGFSATESLSRAYKAHYGVSPSKDRQL